MNISKNVMNNSKNYLCYYLTYSFTNIPPRILKFGLRRRFCTGTRIKTSTTDLGHFIRSFLISKMSSHIQFKNYNANAVGYIY